MLHIPADFPAPGSDAFLAPTGEQVRIQRRNDDGSLLISRSSTVPGTASGNMTVPGGQLHAKRMDAINAGPHRRRRAASR